MLFADYKKALNAPHKLQRFENSVLAKAYMGSGTKISERLIGLCVDDSYHFDSEASRCTTPCSAGIDVGPEWFDVRISSYRNTGGKRRMEWAGKVKDWEDVTKLFDRHCVTCAVIDAEPETRGAVSFQRSANCDVYLCYTRELGNLDQKDVDLTDVDKDKKVFTIDRTVMMDEVLASWIGGEHIVPKNYAFIANGQWLAEMVNPARVLEVDEEKNTEKWVWTGGADHSFLADVYDLCASRLGHFEGGSGSAFTGDRMIATYASDRQLLTPLDSY